MPDNTDSNLSIEYFKKEVEKFIEERGWTKFHTPKNLVQALNCEAGELSQLLLFKEYTKKDVLSNQDLFANICDEIADVFIYLLSLVNALDIDLSETFLKKMQKNRQKYSKEEFNDGTYFKK